MTEINGVINLIGLDLTIKILITLGVSFLSVSLINVLKWLIEGIVTGIKLTESEKIIKILEHFVYPFLTVFIAIPIPFFIKTNSYNYFINLCIYITLNFMFYKILWKMIIEKITEKIKGV